jgi:hypothetical protein
VGAGIRKADFADVPIGGELRRVWLQILADQDVPERMPSVDVIRFDEQGRLWARTVGEDLANLHPYVLDGFPERGPAHRSWDVFGPRGALEFTAELPARFDPWVMHDSLVWGLWELPSGERTVARATLRAGAR